MSPSRPFILRPVATSLLMVAIMLVGIVAYTQLPVSALPEVDYPTIQVLTFYPGASPDVVATTVTAPLERHAPRAAGRRFERTAIRSSPYHYRLSKGFPKSDGAKSSRKRSSCVRIPNVRPASLFSGTMTSAETCQTSATYASPGFIVAIVRWPSGETKANSTSGTS